MDLVCDGSPQTAQVPVPLPPLAPHKLQPSSYLSLLHSMNYKITVLTGLVKLSCVTLNFNS